MLINEPRPLKTASAPHSIWRDLGEDNFRENIARLVEVSGRVPCDARTNDLEHWEEAHLPATEADERLLDLRTERLLADDLAFIAVYKKDSTTVSAVAIEEPRHGEGLVIRVAANQGVASRTQIAFRSIFERLSSYASKR